MNDRYGNAAPGELVPGLVLPPAIHGELRQLLARIEAAGAAEYPRACARAEGVVRGLEVGQVLEQARIERLYLLIEDVATARALELESGG